ncbi:hypothetical protein ACMD2_11984 [Ananas comosus]|uniref:LysM domain-containing protein n=1 Tax=Ananas comosus TaxID=4615 RepID=A0A199UWR1_ANACO|nr:hypothetical protein ACMD2_11984 [Ananas comosus]
MVASSSPMATAIAAIADAASWCCALAVVALVVLCTLRAGPPTAAELAAVADEGRQFDAVLRGARLAEKRLCDEIYVVGEGETLHSISDKCGDPFIVERNPHVHDPDDVFPGLVIKLIPHQHV